MKPLWAVILAAGEGKRMHSRLPKVLHPLCGRRMLEYILGSAAELTEQVLIVVGHGASEVKEAIGDRWRYVLQERQLGTGHAVMQALEYLPREGTLLVLCGDTPLLEVSDLRQLVDCQRDHAAVVATVKVPDPAGYGRVLRDQHAQIEKIVEDRDASDEQKEICEINTGTYCFDIEPLRFYLPRLNTDNTQNEYYLPDVLSLMRQDGRSVGACCLDDYRIGLGINDRAQLAEAAAIIRRKINHALMMKGVTIEDPGSVHIDFDVEIGVDTVVRPGCVLEKGTVVGAECEIGPGAHLSAAVIEDRTVIRYAAVNNCTIKSGAVIGPFVSIDRELEQP